MKWFLDYMESHDDGAGWVLWYGILRGGGGDDRVVVGNGGFKGKPAPDGTAEVGYSILEEFQGRGYATEMTRALVAWAFSHPRVTRVVAETYPELTRSIRVMEKCGMRFVGPGSEERVIRYGVERERWARP
jgi:RimJ/RimL family protein N-acetyltransferase